MLCHGKPYRWWEIRHSWEKETGRIRTDITRPWHQSFESKTGVHLGGRQLQLSSDVTGTPNSLVKEVRWDPTCWDMIGSSVLCLLSKWMDNSLVPYLRSEMWGSVLAWEIRRESICWAGKSCNSGLVVSLCYLEKEKVEFPGSHSSTRVNSGKAQRHFSRSLS